MEKITWLQVPDTCSYVNYGVDDGTCLNYIEVNIIRNAHNYGVSIVDMDGKEYTKYTLKGEKIEILFTFDNKDLKVVVLPNELKNMIEVIIHEL